MHYNNDNVGYWWSVKPVIAKLTDFGESRSSMIQTNTIIQTKNFNLNRGSPAYMAPELTGEEKLSADIDALKAADMWGYGTIIFHLLNPDAVHPYYIEMRDIDENVSKLQALKQCLLSRCRPAHSDKYSTNRRSVWHYLITVFEQCCSFTPERRANADRVSSMISNGSVDITNLCVSQGEYSVTKYIEPTDNACSFLVLIVADQLMNCNTSSVENVVENAILNFPKQVNEMRDFDKLYSAHEALSLLNAVGLCKRLELDIIIITSSIEKNISECKGELCKCLTSVMASLEGGSTQSFSAVYICPPYSLLIYKPVYGNIAIIDTHSLLPEFGGI